VPINNKIEKVFEGPPQLAGYLFLITGLFLIPLNGFSLGYILIGGGITIASCFVIFSWSGVKIDTGQRLIKQYTKLFGIIEIGDWQRLDTFKGITLVPFRRVEGMASWSNRTTSVTKKDYRVFLVNKAKKPAFAIKTCETREQAQNSLDEFSIWLKMPVFSVKKQKR
jgi:hypothetical protein